MATNPPVEQPQQEAQDNPVVVKEDDIPDMNAQTEDNIRQQYEDAMPEEEQPTQDVPSTDQDVARAAREERMRLLPEYLEHFFLEDLPPINPDDPFNQGIYIRYRINQVRDAKDMEPVE